MKERIERIAHKYRKACSEAKAMAIEVLRDMLNNDPESCLLQSDCLICSNPDYDDEHDDVHFYDNEYDDAHFYANGAYIDDEGNIIVTSVMSECEHDINKLRTDEVVVLVEMFIEEYEKYNC